MLALTHTLISLPFAVYLKNPVLIFMVAFLWHLFADTLLHWNLFLDKWKKYFYPMVALDVIGGVVVAYFIVGQDLFTAPYLAAIAGGNAPDVLHGLWDLLGKEKQTKYFTWAKPWFRFHDNLQFETNSIARGLISQIILVVVALALWHYKLTR